jgi:hypothetical protein
MSNNSGTDNTNEDDDSSSPKDRKISNLEGKSTSTSSKSGKSNETSCESKSAKSSNEELSTSSSSPHFANSGLDSDGNVGLSTEVTSELTTEGNNSPVDVEEGVITDPNRPVDQSV